MANLLKLQHAGEVFNSRETTRNGFHWEFTSIFGPESILVCHLIAVDLQDAECWKLILF